MRIRKLFSPFRLSVGTLGRALDARVNTLAPRRRLLRFSVLFLFAASFAATAQAPKYTSIVIFGDSLSDTGNLAATTYANCGIPIPGPLVDYTLGAATDGFDTIPAAQRFTGVWAQQLAALLSAAPTTPSASPRTATALPLKSSPAWAPPAPSRSAHFKSRTLNSKLSNSLRGPHVSLG